LSEKGIRLGQYFAGGRGSSWKKDKGFRGTSGAKGGRKQANEIETSNTDVGRGQGRKRLVGKTWEKNSIHPTMPTIQRAGGGCGSRRLVGFRQVKIRGVSRLKRKHRRGRVIGGKNGENHILNFKKGGGWGELKNQRC